MNETNYQQWVSTVEQAARQRDVAPMAALHELDRLAEHLVGETKTDAQQVKFHVQQLITELAPEHAMMAAAVLQHASLDVTMRHYVHGQQHLAAIKYHAAIADIIARVAAEPVDL